VLWSHPTGADRQEMEDSLDGSWKPWYNERARRDRNSSFSKRIEAFLASRAGELGGIHPNRWLGGQDGLRMRSS